MTTTPFGQDLAAAAATMRGHDTMGQAAKDWEAEAKRLAGELEALSAKYEPFDDAMGEIFAICLEHVPEDFETEEVARDEEGTVQDYQVVARNVLRIVKAAIDWSRNCEAEAEAPRDGAGGERPQAVDWDESDFQPADMTCDEIYVGTRKYLAIDKVEEALDQVREAALREAMSAVNRTAAPIAGTPYSAGGRRFAEAVEARLKLPRPRLVDTTICRAHQQGREEVQGAIKTALGIEECQCHDD